MKVMKMMAMMFSLLFAVSSHAVEAPSSKNVALLLGKGVDAAKSTLATTAAVEAYEPDASHKGHKQLFARTKGVRVFFGADGKAITIRLDRPFAGDVGGVRIGDTLAKLKSTLGEPVQNPSAFGDDTSYLYYPDDNYSARFDVSQKGVVTTMLLFK